MTMLAHAGGADEFTSSILVAAGLVAGWVGLSRLRGRGFPRIPRWGGIALVAVAPAVAVSAVVIPSLVWPAAGGPRPASTASIGFAQPLPGQAVTGDTLRIRVELEGGVIADGASTELAPDTGHVHVFLDGELLSMTYGLEQDLAVGDLAAGTHRLRAEYVAVDHVPFDPPVAATVTFVREAR